MTTNGGIPHQGLPPTSRTNLNCSQCGVLLDSIESLNVHNMHYHFEDINRWGPPPSGIKKSTTASMASMEINSTTDFENTFQHQQTTPEPHYSYYQYDPYCGNQVTSSPSEFPSTTTPQENGAQFRTSFEAAPEQSGSPEYTTQYTTPLGFQQTQTFQQYGTGLALHSTAGSSPNGQLGPSILASQPRGQLISLDNTGTYKVLPEEEQQLTFMDPTLTTTYMSDYSLIVESVNEQQFSPFNTSATCTDIIAGSEADNMQAISDMSDYSSILETFNYLQSSPLNTSVTCTEATRRSLGGVPHQDHPFSPDIAEPNNTHLLGPIIPLSGATQPHSPTQIASPSATPVTHPAIETPATPTTPNLRCELCNKVFSKSCYRTQHDKYFHSGEKSFKCDTCGKKFVSDQSYKEHIAKHVAEKPHKCNDCPKSYNHKTDLNRHRSCHTGNKPHICPICKKGFSRNDQMVKHTETHNRKEAKLAKKLGN